MPQAEFKLALVERGDEDEGRAGGVVTDSDAGRWLELRLSRGFCSRLVELNGDSCGGCQLFGDDGAGAVEQHGCLGGVEDGGFEANGGGAGV